MAIYVIIGPVVTKLGWMVHFVKLSLSTRHSLMLDLSQMFQMLKEVKIFGAGHMFM